MSHVMRIKDEHGNWIPIPTIKGDQGPEGPKGDKGDTGIGLQVKGTYATLAALQAAATDPAIGDMYNVGSAAPFNIYMWNGNAWENQGQLQGTKGDKGEKGDTGDQGPQGEQGIQGVQGETGPKGDKGDTGDTGQDGADGAPGPNEITTGTDTTISGIIKGASGKAAQAVAGTDYATPEQVDEKLSIPAQFTALPTSGTALVNNAEYRVSATVGTYTFAWPSSPFEVWLKFTTAATFNIAFPAGTTYIGGAPTFAASKTYEMSVKDGVVIVQEVAAA